MSTKSDFSFASWVVITGGTSSLWTVDSVSDSDEATRGGRPSPPFSEDSVVEECSREGISSEVDKVSTLEEPIKGGGNSSSDTYEPKGGSSDDAEDEPTKGGGSESSDTEAEEPTKGGRSSVPEVEEGAQGKSSSPEELTRAGMSSNTEESRFKDRFCSS